jgi:hypothetical protein
VSLLGYVYAIRDPKSMCACCESAVGGGGGVEMALEHGMVVDGAG